MAEFTPELTKSFELISGGLKVPMLLVRRDGVIVSANEAAAGLIGSERASLPGRRLQETVAEPESAVQEYLDAIAGKLQPLDARFAWQAKQDSTYATCTGKLLAPDRGSGEELILIHISPEGAYAPDSLEEMKRRLEELTRELEERRRAEEGLRESRERFQRAQQAAHLGTWDWQVGSGRLIWDGIPSLHGRQEGDFRGSFRAFARDILPEDRERVIQAIHSARNSGQEMDVEYRILRKDGSVRWVSGRGRTFRSEDGRILRMSGTCQDITDRKKAEESLAFLASASKVLSSSLHYRETLQGLARLLVPFLGDWCAIYVNQQDSIERTVTVHAHPEKAALAAQYQASFPVDPAGRFGPAEVIRSGQSSYAFQGPPSLEHAGPAEQQALLSTLGMRSIMIVPMRARDRTIGAISLGMGDSGRVYCEDDLALAEEIGGRAGLAVDNALLFEESQRSQAELRRANGAKDEFLGILAHEIRSPTTTLYGTSRIMRGRWRTLDEETMDDLIAGLEEQSERLNRLIQNLLVIARMDLGHEIPREDVDMTMLTEKTVSDYVKRRSSRTITTDLTILPPASLVTTYMEQVIRNLIENADKYSPAEEPINVSLRPSGAGFALRVQDRGPGINPEEINLVFESFYRADRTAGQAAGKGLGLTVCKRLIEAQGGHIWARNRPGGGLEVGFWLPVEQPAELEPAAAQIQA